MCMILNEHKGEHAVIKTHNCSMDLIMYIGKKIPGPPNLV